MTLDEKIYELVIEYDGGDCGTSEQARDITTQIKRTILEEIEKIPSGNVYSESLISLSRIRELLGERK